MLQDLINSNIPLIFVETDEPGRVDFANNHKDMVGFWQEKFGFRYHDGKGLEKISSTDSVEAAIEYLAATKKKFLAIFYGEPDYERLSTLPDYHTVVFVHHTFRDYVGAVRISLPLPSKEEYFEAFHKAVRTNNKIQAQHAEWAIGMRLKDAVNCHLYSFHTSTDFLSNKRLFVQSSFLDYVKTDNDFSILGGFDEFKKWFNERKHWYKIDNFPRQKGVLLYGNSGIGKSLCASCLGNEAELPLYKFDFTRVYSKYVGRSEDNMRKALDAIEKVSPAIVWIEEIGRMFSGKNIQSNIAHHQVLSIFLDWLQSNDKDIFIAATANDIKNIPKELTRPGRFNLKYMALMPNKEAREQIFAIKMKEYGIPARLLEDHANATARLSGAEIEDVIQEAVIQAHATGLAPSTTLKDLLGIKK